MQTASLIAYNFRTGTATVSCNHKQYTARLSQDLGLKIGAQAAIEIDSAPGLFRPGCARILNGVNFDLTQYQGTALCPDPSVPDHRMLECSSEYCIVGEGSSFSEAAAAAVERLEGTFANAIVNFKFDAITFPASAKILYRAGGNPAMIDGERYQAEPGRKLRLPISILRRNSPNLAMTRYIRVLLFCLLLIFLPMIPRLYAQGLLPNRETAMGVSAALFAGAIALGLYFHPNDKKGYLFKPRMGLFK